MADIVKLQLDSGSVCWIGSCPGRYDSIEDSFSELKDLGIDLIVNLLTEDDYNKDSMPYYADYEALRSDYELNEIFRYPIEDFGIPNDLPDFARAVDHIHFLVRDGRRVFIHCAAGVGRTGFFSSALFFRIREGQVIMAQAIQHIRRYRTGAVETEGQRLFLESYAAHFLRYGPEQA